MGHLVQGQVRADGAMFLSGGLPVHVGRPLCGLICVLTSAVTMHPALTACPHPPGTALPCRACHEPRRRVVRACVATCTATAPAACLSASDDLTAQLPPSPLIQAPPTNFSRAVALGGGLYVCGDHRDSATFDGAIKSGRRAAEAIAAAK